MKYMYVLPGVPVPLARPRHSKSHVYDPQAQQKLLGGITISGQVTHEIITKPISLEATFYMPIPKTFKNKRLQEKIGMPHSITPDLDNLLKYVCDISTGVVYKDDALIVAIISRKIYDEVPRTEFTIEVLP